MFSGFRFSFLRLPSFYLSDSSWRSCSYVARSCLARLFVGRVFSKPDIFILNTQISISQFFPFLILTSKFLFLNSIFSFPTTIGSILLVLTSFSNISTTNGSRLPPFSNVTFTSKIINQIRRLIMHKSTTLFNHAKGSSPTDVRQGQTFFSFFVSRITHDVPAPPPRSSPPAAAPKSIRTAAGSRRRAPRR